MKCAQCNREIGENQKFCKYCGAAVKRTSFSTEGTMQIKKCKSCGAVLKPGNIFCTQCGSPISVAEDKAAGRCTVGNRRLSIKIAAGIADGIDKFLIKQ